MKKTLAFFALALSLAATRAEERFCTIADSLSVPAEAEHTHNEWESMEGVKGVAWKWPVHLSGKHKNTLEGTMKGDVEIDVTGRRTYVSTVTITVPDERPDLAHFGKGKITKIPTTCDAAYFMYNVGLYRLEKPGKKPLYISYESNCGSAGAGMTTYHVAPLQVESLESLSTGRPKHCKVLNK